MRFPYVRLAFNTNANEMYAQHKSFYLYYTFFSRIKYFGGHRQMLCTFFCLKRVWFVGVKSLLSVPSADCLAFSDPTQVLKHIV